MTTVPSLMCQEFLLRLAQYWAVVCATRKDRLRKKDPAAQAATTVILRLWQHRDEIANGTMDGVTYSSGTSSLQIRAADFEQSIGKGLKRPFRIFSEGRQFLRSIRTFARNKPLQDWRTGASPSLDRAAKLLDRFQKEGGVDLGTDLKYIGVLTANKKRSGEVNLAFARLGPTQAKAYGEGLLPASK